MHAHTARPMPSFLHKSTAYLFIAHDGQIAIVHARRSCLEWQKRHLGIVMWRDERKIWRDDYSDDRYPGSLGGNTCAGLSEIRRFRTTPPRGHAVPKKVEFSRKFCVASYLRLLTRDSLGNSPDDSRCARDRTRLSSTIPRRFLSASRSGPNFK